MELNSTGSATALQGLRPYALGKEEGQAIWFLGTLTFVKATKASTGGAYGLIEQVIPAGFSSPYHVHHDEDEAFYVLEGEITFYCGDQRLKGGPGTYVFGPREIPHGFKVEGDHPARLLLLASPGGFEQFVIDASDAGNGTASACSRGAGHAEVDGPGGEIQHRDPGTLTRIGGGKRYQPMGLPLFCSSSHFWSGAK